MVVAFWGVLFCLLVCLFCGIGMNCGLFVSDCFLLFVICLVCCSVLVVGLIMLAVPGLWFGGLCLCSMCEIWL